MQQYREIETALNKVDKAVDINGEVGRPGAFDIEIDGKYMVHSKLKSSRFPDMKSIATQIVDYATTGKPHSSWTPSS